MIRERFSRAYVLKELEIRINNIQVRRNFTTETGYRQVEGKDSATNRDYGAWRAYRDLVAEFKD
jgi:hypothetical protein